jgi:hypothetical protein
VKRKNQVPILIAVKAMDTRFRRQLLPKLRDSRVHDFDEVPRSSHVHRLHAGHTPQSGFKFEARKLQERLAPFLAQLLTPG